jgi:hypothetical protein
MNYIALYAKIHDIRNTKNHNWLMKNDNCYKDAFNEFEKMVFPSPSPPLSPEKYLKA